MSREDIVAIAARLFAIFLGLLALRLGAGAFSTAAMGDMPPQAIVISVVFAVLPLLVAVFLWYFPLTVARKLLPAMRDSGAAMAATARQVQEICFSVLGLWVVAKALSDAVYWITLGVLSLGFPEGQLDVPVEDKASLLATVAELVIGFALLLGSKGLVGLLYRLRYSGPQSPAP